MKEKQYCDKFSKDFKNSPHEKNLKKTKQNPWGTSSQSSGINGCFLIPT